MPLIDLHIVTDNSPQLEQTSQFAQDRIGQMVNFDKKLGKVSPVVSSAGVGLRSLVEMLKS